MNDQDKATKDPTRQTTGRSVDNRIRLGPVALGLMVESTPDGEAPSPKHLDEAISRLVGGLVLQADSPSSTPHSNFPGSEDLADMARDLVSKFDGAIDGMGDELLAKIGELNNTQLNVERAINMLRYMFTVLAADEPEDQRECIHRANTAIDGLITPLKNAPDLLLVQEKTQDVSEYLTQARAALRSHEGGDGRDPDPTRTSGPERER